MGSQKQHTRVALRESLVVIQTLVFRDSSFKVIQITKNLKLEDQ